MTTSKGKLWYVNKLWHYKPTDRSKTYLSRSLHKLEFGMGLTKYCVRRAIREFRTETIKAALEVLANYLIAYNRYRNSGAPEDREKKAKTESSFLSLALWTNGVIRATDEVMDKTFEDATYFETTKLLLKEIREA